MNCVNKIPAEIMYIEQIILLRHVQTIFDFAHLLGPTDKLMDMYRLD